MKNKIFVLGSINIDLVISSSRMPENGETMHGSNFLINSGGKGANQAVAASKLGADVSLIGSLGNDEFRAVALNSLLKSGVSTKYVKQSMEKTTGVAVIVKVDGDNRIILDAGSNFDINEKDIDFALKEANENDIFISQFEINMDAINYGLRKAKEKEMITILNPAPAKNIDEETYKYIDYLVVNQSESEHLSNIYPNNLEDSLKVFDFFKKKGIKNLIITLGSKGSIYLSDNLIYEKESYKVVPIDTTGAGDSFIGSFAYGLLNNYSIEKSIDFANATSALVCLKHGAQQSMPNKEEVLKVLEGGII